MPNDPIRPTYQARCPAESPHRMVFLEMFGRLDRIPLCSDKLHRWEIPGHGHQACYQLDVLALEPELFDRLVRFYEQHGLDGEAVRQDLVHWGMVPLRQLDLIIEETPTQIAPEDLSSPLTPLPDPPHSHKPLRGAKTAVRENNSEEMS